MNNPSNNSVLGIRILRDMKFSSWGRGSRFVRRRQGEISNFSNPYISLRIVWSKNE